MPPDIYDPFSTAQIIGYVALLIGISALLQHCDQRVRFLMTVMSLVLCIHFYFLGSPAAAITSVLSATRSGLSMFRGMRRYAHIFVPGFICVLVGFAVFSIDSWIDVLPMLSTALGTYAYFYWESPKLRYAFVTGSILWLIHNALAYAYGPFVMELCLLGANIYRLRTLRK